MILDAHNLFSDAQAITANAASTNLIDLGAARDIGTGENLYCVLIVDTAFTDSGSNSTGAVTLQTDDNASFSSALDAQLLFTIATNAAAGTLYAARLAPGAINERYCRLNYVMSGGDFSAGAVTAFFTHDVQKYVSYADGITIS